MKTKTLRRAATVLLAVMAGTLLWQLTGGSRTRHVRIMTYNVQHCQGLDGTVDYQRLADIISRERPDVVALQELDSVAARTADTDQLERLAELTGMHPLFSRGIPLGRGAYGVGMLCRQRPTVVRRIPLPGTEPRTLLIADFGSYVACCTHWDLSDSCRVSSARIITELLSSERRPLLLCGDLNSESGSAEQDILRRSFRILSDEALHTFPADNPRVTIDYVCGLQNGTDYQVEDARVPAEATASDHRPVVVSLRLKPVRK